MTPAETSRLWFEARQMISGALESAALRDYRLLDVHDIRLGGLDALAFEYRWLGLRGGSDGGDHALLVWAPTPLAVFHVYHHCAESEWAARRAELDAVLGSFVALEAGAREKHPQPHAAPGEGRPQQRAARSRMWLQPTTWDGLRRAATLRPEALRQRGRLADAARDYRWSLVIDLLRDDPHLVNSTRPDGPSLFAPLHQAAHGGAPLDVVQTLLDLGAWRTLLNARGERAVDVAARKHHVHLLPVLEPRYARRVPPGVLLAIQARFHDVIRGRVEQLVDKYGLRLPELGPLLELEHPGMWFAVPGFYGGFRFELAEVGAAAVLVSTSWCRVCGGSGERHRITSRGSELVERGFA
jgi:hypothetical protein